MAGYLAAQLGKTRPYAHALWAGSIISFIFFVTKYTSIIQMFTKTTEVTLASAFDFFYLPLGILTYLLGALIYTQIQKIP
jgi:hypothetical protein